MLDKRCLSGEQRVVSLLGKGQFDDDLCSSLSVKGDDLMIFFVKGEDRRVPQGGV